ncbi:hypothetical protein [Lysinibacillus sp. G4S2]|uniref:hypothetical protein n=1 Tax=Lysinibacillus sp. G4S2 TaxID=3055859 RepID=UPI0025A13E95|nr:hypothetical protein [Lysinibacillus sp. G4S2]MDM5249627.1 hypothetical protein [Lysinibacillus sp. G4S2]
MKYCIYLKKGEPEVNFLSEEHIFPAGIGGIRKLPIEYVSHDCNNKFSIMEQTFMRESVIAIPRQFYGPGKRGNLNPKNATKSEVSVITDNENDVQLGYISLGKPYKIMQMKWNKNGSCRFSTNPRLGDAHLQLETFLINMKNFTGKFKKRKTPLLDENQIILGLHNNMWYVAYNDEKIISELAVFISKVLEQKPFETQEFQYQQNQISVHSTTVVDDSYYRVCAKIIFNYLAFIKGQEFVLNNCFDKLREWIVKGGEQNLVQIVDKGIVEELEFPDQSHSLFITKVQNNLVGYISFYGNAFKNLILLSDEFFESFWVEGFICDWKNREEYDFLQYLNEIRE